MKSKPMPPNIRNQAVLEIARFKSLKREPITLEEEFDLFGLAMVEWLYGYLQEIELNDKIAQLVGVPAEQLTGGPVTATASRTQD